MNMSFNKYFIPEPIDLAKLFIANGAASVVNRKIDAIIGNSTSIQMFDRASSLVQEGKSDETVLKDLSDKFPIYFK